VFYDKGNYQGGWRYLECSLADIGSKEWGAQNTNISTSPGLGAGKANTAAILAADPAAGAAKACADYRGGGKNDWWLPSKDELDLACETMESMYPHNHFFWSSSQYADDSSYCRSWPSNFTINKGRGTQPEIPEGTTYLDRETSIFVVAVRAF
ncbi:MAG: hypothetical protein LBD18_07545, partial [Treponema sp.]|jgi:hypothetical protein|nr:hypothetical protein [Treponema sp.]